MRKRVVLLAKYFPPHRGGMEVFVQAVAEALRDEFAVTVLAHATGRRTVRERWDGFDVWRCGTWITPLSQPISPAMPRLLRQLAPDIVHLHAPNATATLAWWLAARSAPLVITHHADIAGRRWAKRAFLPLYNCAVARAGAVTVLSRKNAAVSQDLPAAAVAKLVAIPFGLDPAAGTVDPALLRAADMVRQTLVPTGAPLVASIGRLVAYKGLDVLIAALALLPGVHAAIAGEGPLAASLAAPARAEGVADRVHFLGAVDESTKRALLVACDALILPSVTVAETFGIVQVEAQLFARPVIASDLPTGVTDVTVHGETGLLMPPGDAAALARAIGTILSDPGLRERYGRAGRVRALARFARPAFDEAFRDLFRSVAADLTGSRPEC